MMIIMKSVSSHITSLSTRVCLLECPKLIIRLKNLKIQENRSKPTTDPADTRPLGAEVAPLVCRLQSADSEVVMVDLAFGDDFLEQNRSWDDFGTTISSI